MDEFTGSASLDVEAKPKAVFGIVTNLERLPTWNAAIERVTEQPETLTCALSHNNPFRTGARR
ncbi:hypothetical protein EDD99_3307 [Streptomyces sp. 846.5]|nr:hypothetical protein EDD99_3307 [Streptomyces sp. 846.5]